jgi:hypothetical protein
MQVTFLARLTLPRYWLATVRKIANTIAFYIRRLWATELADNAQSLVVFLDLDLNFSDVFLVGGNPAPDLLRSGGVRGADAIGHRQ